MQRHPIERGGFILFAVAGVALGFWMGRNSAPRSPQDASGNQKTGVDGGTAEERRGGGKPGNAGATSVLVAQTGLPDSAGQAAGAAPRPAEAMRRELLQALREPNLTERVLRIAAAMQKLSPENWRGMLAALAEEKNLHGRQHGDVRLLLAQRAGEVVGVEALKHFLSGDDDDATRAALTGWTIKNPVSALAWLGKEADSETRRRFIGAAIRGLALTEPDLAISELESIPIERRKNYTGRFVDSLVRATGLDGTEALIGGMINRAAAANTVKDDYLANLFWDFAQLKIEQANTTGDFRGLADWLQRYVGQPYVNPAIVGAVVDRYVQTDPLKAFQWLETYNRENMAAGQTNTVGYDFLMAAWTQKEGAESVGRWLGQMTAHPHYDRITQRYSAVVAANDPVAAMRWAQTIKAPALKAAAVEYIQKVGKPKG